MSVQKGTIIELGMKEPLPLVGFPEGKVIIKQRPNREVRIYVRTSTGIRDFCVKEVNGCWEPAFEMGRNSRGNKEECAEW